MNLSLENIGKQFSFEGTVKEIRTLGEGLINDTFFVETEGKSPNYILQRKNKSIFKNVPAMMENIHKVTTHLKKKIVQRGGNPLRESLTLTPTQEGNLYYQDTEGEYWAACLFIEDAVTHEAAHSLELARQGGKGIGLFQSMLADMNETLIDTLPGFHNMRYRFQQWDDTLAKDSAGRKAIVQEEIGWIEQRREEMLAFWHKAETGEIPSRITHNDTKISNILFDKEDNILCVIDLDTVLSSICLNDYGDAIRSYANTGLEDDKNLDNVSLNLEIFKSYTSGYLSEALSFLTPVEKEYLAFSARYITFEQVLRFLMDYIDGDTYYKVKYPEQNLVRTRAQYKLLTSMEKHYKEMCATVDAIIHNSI
jgi:serine/threonine protein kinase